MKNIRLVWGIVLLMMLFSSCTKQVSNFEEDIPEGTIVLVKDAPQRVSENMILKIVRVEDTRCPIEAICNTPGTVDVKFEVYSDGAINDFLVCYNQTKMCGHGVFNGYMIEVVGVSPFPFANSPAINQMDYRIEVDVEKQ